MPQQVQKKRFQLVDRKFPGESDNLIRVDLIVGQPDGQPFQPILLAVDGGVEHPLRPVAGIHIFCYFVGRDSRRFNFVDGDKAIFCKNAVCPSLDGKSDILHRPFC